MAMMAMIKVGQIYKITRRCSKALSDADIMADDWEIVDE